MSRSAIALPADVQCTAAAATLFHGRWRKRNGETIPQLFIPALTKSAAFSPIPYTVGHFVSFCGHGLHMYTYQAFACALREASA
jgi:hypothetical protein